VQLLRNNLQVPYPLAHARPWVNQRDLVLHAQDLVGLEPELRMVYVVRTGQLVLSDRAEAFFGRVRWADNVAAAFTLERGTSVIADQSG
jgi:hypothetical protein